MGSFFKMPWLRVLKSIAATHQYKFYWWHQKNSQICTHNGNCLGHLYKHGLLHKAD